MKIQSLAIIFVIIILPITILIGEYAGAQIELLNLEQMYDSRLITATDDALKAFQINTFNDAASDIADSKISSIQASVNAFYNSMESSFGLQGYSKEELQRYVPALVYTMYDGYYIYSPYTNIAEINKRESEEYELNINLESNDIQYGFKPYVYYSCRYIMGANSDFIIKYSLDNYITVQGTVHGEIVNESGYLLTIEESYGLKKDGEKYKYNGQEILVEQNLTEKLLEKDPTTQEITGKDYKYIKLNGTKYYWNEEEENIFYLMGGNRTIQVSKAQNEYLYNLYTAEIQNNSSAINYYKNAYEFTDWVNNNLGGLMASHAQANLLDKGDYKIFENDKIEYTGSNFDMHRKSVIRHSIESNLSVAIANFNSYTNSSANFQMPKLDETEWEMLQNEVSIISFLQGINMGGKIYNGYTVVTNNKTEEVVKEERIHITTSDGYYHKINDKHFQEEYEAGVPQKGVLNLDFEIRKDGATGENYIHKTELGCYTSIVGQENVDNTYDSIYEYLKEKDIDNDIKQLYYTALGRERWGTYKVENPSNIESILRGDGEKGDGESETIIAEGLIKNYALQNIDTASSMWNDSNGNIIGTLHGNPEISQKALIFDGYDDWVDIGEIGNYAEALTLEIKFKLDNATNGSAHLISDLGTTAGGVTIWYHYGKILFGAMIDGQYQSISTEGIMTLESNVEYNVSATFDGHTMCLYINGEMIVQKEGLNGKIKLSPTHSIGLGASPWQVENYAFTTNPAADSVFTKGQIYNARIYNRALTEKEIRYNINATQ